MRQRLRARRAEAAAANGPAIAALAAERFLAAFPAQSGQAVGGYWPLAGELDPLPLLRRLQAAGMVILLPVTARRAAPLDFRRWDDLDSAPPPGPYGIPAPPPAAPRLRPDILLVPLVGFDAAGHRLGMGGGFYDATLKALRGDGGGLLAVGYAFAVQQVADLPYAGHDQRLDWIVTERGALQSGKQAG